MREMQQTHDPYDIAPDPEVDPGPAEPVEFASDFRIGLTIHLTEEQVESLSRISQEMGVTEAIVAQRLLEEALVARARS